MNTLRFLFLALLATIVGAGAQSSVRGASLSALPETNQLYLVISNSSAAVFLTAYNTVPSVSYQIQTNADVTNPRGWATWVTVLATDTVTPLSSLGLGYKEIYFRAVTAPSTGTAVTSSDQKSTYLGRLDVSTNYDRNLLTAELTAAGNQSGQTLPGWGRTVNPDGDCNFYVGRNAVVINVPGSRNPHDLAAEINRTNAPRVLQEVEDDFTIRGARRMAGSSRAIFPLCRAAPPTTALPLSSLWIQKMSLRSRAPCCKCRAGSRRITRTSKYAMKARSVAWEGPAISGCRQAARFIFGCNVAGPRSQAR